MFKEQNNLKMKKFLICGLLFAFFVYLANGSVIEERRFREGNSFSRRLRSCNLICSLKGNRGSFNQTLCYRIPSQTAVVTDCVFRCLRNKGESPVAEECKCRNGVCVEHASTPVSPVTNQPVSTTLPATTTEAENPSTEISTNSPPQNALRKGNQRRKVAQGQNSKIGNQSKGKL